VAALVAFMLFNAADPAARAAAIDPATALGVPLSDLLPRVYDSPSPYSNNSTGPHQPWSTAPSPTWYTISRPLSHPTK